MKSRKSDFEEKKVGDKEKRQRKDSGHERENARDFSQDDSNTVESFSENIEHEKLFEKLDQIEIMLQSLVSDCSKECPGKKKDKIEKKINSIRELLNAIVGQKE